LGACSGATIFSSISRSGKRSDGIFLNSLRSSPFCLPLWGGLDFFGGFLIGKKKQQKEGKVEKKEKG